MRNVLEAGTARPRQAHRLRLRQHGAAPPPTIPEGSSYASIASMAGALALGGLLHAVPVQAIEFGSGAFQGSLDTTISHGVAYRVQRRDAELVDGANSNDGNLNYDRGLISNTSKFTTDLDIGTGDFGAFVRTTGFIDFENQNGTRAHVPLSDGAKSRVGRDLELLDAYVTATFDAGDTIIDARLGRHVLSWGESTFVPNGINAINPFDVNKLRLPGSELREALLPVGLASISVAPTDTLSVEGFYQLDWEETELDPVGSYFSVTDYVGPYIGPRKDKAVIALPGLDLGDMGLVAGRNPFAIFSGTSVADAFSDVTEEDPNFLIVRRSADHEPDDSGQWGVAFRYLAEELSNTEFGFYYMNHHSRLPVVGAHTGTAVDTGKGLTIVDAGRKAIMELVPRSVSEALQAARCPSPQASAECGALAQRVRDETTKQLSGLVGAAGIDAFAENGHYFLEYPEDIQLFGVSFNTEIGVTGWALQGEWSYRRDAPLQFAERKVFADTLEPFTHLSSCIAGKVAGGTPSNLAGPACIGERGAAALADPDIVGYDMDTAGYLRRNVSQFQATATKVLGPTMGADGLVFVTEAALMRVHDMPSDIPLESPAGGTLEGVETDADATSWGYRVAVRLDYNNAIGGVNLYPYTQFLHDVSGNSPAPSGPFVEGRTALTIGLRADYLSRWQAGIGYTRYAGKANSLSDRDFVSASIKYSF